MDSRQGKKAQTLGERLQNLMLERGEKVVDLAVRVGIAATTISDYRHDHYEPNLPNLRKLAAYYGVTPFWLKHGIDVGEMRQYEKGVAVSDGTAYD